MADERQQVILFKHIHDWGKLTSFKSCYQMALRRAIVLNIELEHDNEDKMNRVGKYNIQRANYMSDKSQETGAYNGLLQIVIYVQVA